MYHLKRQTILNNPQGWPFNPPIPQTYEKSFWVFIHSYDMHKYYTSYSEFNNTTWLTNLFWKLGNHNNPKILFLIKTKMN